MKLAFTPQGWEDYVHWQTADRKILKRVNRLVDDTLRDPYDGIGKPEPLKHALAGSGPDASPTSTAWSTSPGTTK